MNRHAQEGQIMVMGALGLFVLVLIGLAGAIAAQQSSDYGVISSVYSTAAKEGARRAADGGLVDRAPLLICLQGPSCAPVTCAEALAMDPDGVSAEGRGCQVLRDGLRQDYSPEGRVDVSSVVAATTAEVYRPGDHDRTNPATLYHYPTLCLGASFSIGVIESSGLRFASHARACGHLFYR